MRVSSIWDVLLTRKEKLRGDVTKLKLIGKFHKEVIRPVILYIFGCWVLSKYMNES